MRRLKRNKTKTAQLLTQAKRLGFQAADGLAKKRGYELTRSWGVAPPASWTCLNVGSGGQALAGFTNLDVASEHYDRNRRGPFVQFDMRNDALPFQNASVDLIYCSHVIEHVEDEHVERFFRESARVLRKDGVLRISCPDASFLFQVSSFPNSYWTWRWPLIAGIGVDPTQLEQADFLTREVATSRFHESLAEHEIPHRQPILQTTDEATIEAELNRMTRGLQWNRRQIGQHINWWSYDKVVRFAGESFRHVVRTPYRGSVSQFMRTRDFDKTHPQMSLYVDCVR
jgi:SAM-dependent methyltransferase